MKLHWSPKSPYVRKVMVVAHELGLADEIGLVRSLAVMAKPNPDIMRDNPLSKIPTMVLADGTVLVDSSVISEYLDAYAGGGLLLPPHGPSRWWVLSQQAFISGLLDVLILWRNEREKPDQRQTPEWLSAFSVKTAAALDRLESEMAQFGEQPFSLAHIALGCMLSYLDFRFNYLAWRAGRPLLAQWHQGFEQRPSAQATAIAHG